MLSKIEVVKTRENSIYPMEVRLDGKKLECVRSIDYSVSAGEIPSAKIEFALPSIDAKADVELEHPEVILRHCKTCDLVNELRKREGVEAVDVKLHDEVDLGTFVGPAIVLKIVGLGAFSKFSKKQKRG